MSCRRSTGPARRKRSTSENIATSDETEHDVDAHHHGTGDIPARLTVQRPGAWPPSGSVGSRTNGTARISSTAPATVGTGHPAPPRARQQARREQEEDEDEQAEQTHEAPGASTHATQAGQPTARPRSRRRRTAP